MLSALSGKQRKGCHWQKWQQGAPLLFAPEPVLAGRHHSGDGSQRLFKCGAGLHPAPTLAPKLELREAGGWSRKLSPAHSGKLPVAPLDRHA